MIRELTAWSERLSLIAVWCGGAMLLASAVLIAFEVLMRKLFGFSTGGADELSSYAFAISTSWALSFAALRKAHIRVDVLYGRFGVSLRAWLDILALIALTGFAAILSYHAVGVWRETIALSATANTTLATPLWLPQGLWVCGFLLFSVTLFLLSIRCLTAMVAADFRAVRHLAGSRSVDDEIAENRMDTARHRSRPWSNG